LLLDPFSYRICFFQRRQERVILLAGGDVAGYGKSAGMRTDAAGRVIKKGKLKIARWDVVDYLKTDANMAD